MPFNEHCESAIGNARSPRREADPEVDTALSELANKISDQDMQQLNYALDGQNRDVKEVVHQFLVSKGVLTVHPAQASTSPR